MASWSWGGEPSRAADGRGGWRLAPAIWTAVAPTLRQAMTSDEIRRTFIEFFEQRDHRRLPSSSLIPAEYDPSVLFTIAGMVPLKPYFQGIEKPPHPRA